MRIYIMIHRYLSFCVCVRVYLCVCLCVCLCVVYSLFRNSSKTIGPILMKLCMNVHYVTKNLVSSCYFDRHKHIHIIPMHPHHVKAVDNDF